MEEGIEIINLFLQIKYFRKLGNASLFRRKSKDVGEQDVDTEASEKDSVFKIIFKQVNQQILSRHFPCEQQYSTQTCLYYFKEETERITLNSFQESCEDLKKISNSSAGSSFSGDWFSNLFNKVSNNRCQTALIINFF